MPPSTILSRFSALFKKPEQPKYSGPQEARDIAQFSNGYMLAMQHGLPELLSRLKESAIDESLIRMEGVIEERARSLGATNPKSAMEIFKKMEEFREKLASAKSAEDKQRYSSYLTALDWVLNANGIYPNQQ